MLPAVERAAVISRPKSGQSQQVVAVYPEGAVVDSEILAAAALAERRRVPTTSAAPLAADGNAALAVKPDLLVAYPIEAAQDSIVSIEYWVVALRLNAGAEHHAVVSKLLRWGVSWLQLLCESPQVENNSLHSTLAESGISASLSDFSIFDSAFAGNASIKSAASQAALVLKRALDADRVIIARGRAQKLSIVAVSDVGQFDKRVNALRDAETQLQEACSKARTLFLNASNTQEQPGQSGQPGKSCIVVTPMLVQDICAGAVLVESVKPITAATVAQLESLASILAAQFILQQYQHSWTIVAMRRRAKSFFARLLGEGFLKTKLATASIAAMLILLFAIPGEYRVSAAANLEGEIQRAVVAPFDGYIATAHRRAGDTVKMGDVLAELDQRQMALERARWLSEKAELDKEYRKAFAEMDQAQAQILKSQIAQATARLDLVDQQMQRAELLAPLDGIIIDGNLNASLGAPVQRGDILFEVAPLDAYRIILEVNEREIRNIAEGQRGWLSLTALPGERIPFVIERVATVFEQKESQVIYRTEARVAKPVGFLRPGMQGTGKISVGHRSYAYILFHDMIDWMRLKLWSLAP
ncbi:MAG: efflux RND transporter periplasmic adaptor subunit [Pseudomonadales bacterium]